MFDVLCFSGSIVLDWVGVLRQEERLKKIYVTASAQPTAEDFLLNMWSNVVPFSPSFPSVQPETKGYGSPELGIPGATNSAKAEAS